MEPNLWQVLGELFVVLGQLLVALAAIAGHWLLLIVWIAWWLLAVNWRKGWRVLADGGWAPLVLLTLITALAWSRIQPVPWQAAPFVTIPNFLWQLACVVALVLLALICGWLQGVLGWRPAEIDLEPPAHSHAHAGHH